MGNPEKRFSAGGVNVTIWMNESIKDGQLSTYPSVTFDKRYKDKDGNWKSTNSLGLSDIPKAIMVLGKAYEHLALKTSTPAPAEAQAPAEVAKA